MQSRDELENIVATDIFPESRKRTPHEQITDLVNSLELAKEKGAVSHVVAPLPVAGQTVEILGLTYKVKYSSPGRGKLVLELERPSNEQADPVP